MLSMSVLASRADIAEAVEQQLAPMFMVIEHAQDLHFFSISDLHDATKAQGSQRVKETWACTAAAIALFGSQVHGMVEQYDSAANITAAPVSSQLRRILSEAIHTSISALDSLVMNISAKQGLKCGVGGMPCHYRGWSIGQRYGGIMLDRCFSWNVRRTSMHTSTCACTAA